MYIYIYIYIYVCVCARARLFVHVCVYTHTHTPHKHTHTHTCLRDLAKEVEDTVLLEAASVGIAQQLSEVARIGKFHDDVQRAYVLLCVCVCV